MSRGQRAKLPAFNSLFHERELGEKADNVRDKKAPADFFSLLNHRVGVGKRWRDGLFDDDVLAGFQGLDRHGPVQLHGKADVDQIDVGIVEQVSIIRIGPHS